MGLTEIFRSLVTSGKINALLRKTDMPNIPLKTLGGHVFWNDLAKCNGWRLQKNMVFKQCRILDPNNVRRAWGGDEAMKRLFEELDKEH